MVELLSRAKMAPLHLEAESYRWRTERVAVFGKQLEAHISHTRHLTFSGHHLSTVVDRPLSPTSTLESLSLISSLLGYPIILNNLFNLTAPSLTILKLVKYDIDWKSPLLKGPRTLEILGLSTKARPELNYWLDALNDLPKLKELSLRSVTPVAPLAGPLISRTVTLPSLTHFGIDESAKGCVFALAHLVLPNLTQLHVDVKSHDRKGVDVLLVIPHVVRHVWVMHGIEPIQSILIAGERKDTKILTWTTPGADVDWTPRKICHAPHVCSSLQKVIGGKNHNF